MIEIDFASSLLTYAKLRRVIDQASNNDERSSKGRQDCTPCLPALPAGRPKHSPASILGEELRCDQLTGYEEEAIYFAKIAAERWHQSAVEDDRNDRDGT